MKRVLTLALSTLALSLALAPSAKAINQVERIQLLPQISFPLTSPQVEQAKAPSTAVQGEMAMQTMKPGVKPSSEIKASSELERPTFEYFENILRDRYGY